MKVKNISDSPQHFANIGTFEAGETKDVANDVADYLLKSPHIVKADAPVRAKEQDKPARSMRAIE